MAKRTRVHKASSVALVERPSPLRETMKYLNQEEIDAIIASCDSDKAVVLSRYDGTEAWRRKARSCVHIAVVRRAPNLKVHVRAVNKSMVAWTTRREGNGKP